VLGALPNTTTMTIPVSQLYNSDGYPDFDDFDPEGDAFGIYQVSPGNNAQSVSLERGNVIFNLTPGLTYPNTATFTYTLRDRFNNISDRATVTVNLGKLLQGTNKPDQLSGSAFPDRIEGSGGNDSLVGLAGDDLISGGSGRDILNGGTGRDRLTGGADADSLILDSGEDTVVMNRLDDSLLRAPDVIQGGGGTVNIDVPGNRNVSADFDGFLVPTLTQPLTEKNVKKLLEVLDPDNSFVSVGVSPFKYNNPQSGGTQTFLAIDNGDHIFSGSSDSILEVRGDFYNAHVF
jgi:Ca2+-binding RTX toxin-like protein